MDAAGRVRELAVHVGEIHLAARRWIAEGPGRNPLQLPEELWRIRLLIDDLQRYVHPMVPSQIFAHHLRNTRDIEDELLAIERGFAGAVNVVEEEDDDDREGAVARMKRSNLPADELMDLINLKYQLKEIAEVYSCSVKTVRRRLADLGYFHRAWLKSNTDEELAEHIHRWWETADAERTGSNMAWGWLISQGVPCTRDQVRAVIEALQPEAVLARSMQTVVRREYHVPFPNSLWHLDSHNKLIHWKFVIHGAIDGHSHLITYMGASDNNRASTVRELFVQATEAYGWPQRVRADYGGENVDVGQAMEARRGEDRGSFITGASTHNQRIERLWRDLRKDVVDKFATELKTMELEGILDVEDPLHLYSLHFVFLPLLQVACDNFATTYNNHHPSTVGSGGMSPRKQFHKGLMNASRNGFAFNHFPEEEREWFGAVRANGVLDVDGYNPDGPGNYVRQRQEQDPHVQVDRFGDYLPNFLYAPDFVQQLSDRFPTPLFQQARNQYVNILDFVARVPEWQQIHREGQ